MINEVESRITDNPLYYSEKMKSLVQVIKADQWTKPEKSRYPAFYKVMERISEKDSLLFMDSSRFIPDPSRGRAVLVEAHGLHVDISKTKARIAEAFWWPKWSEDTIAFVDKCPHCMRSDRTKSTRKAPLIPVELPEGP